MNLKTLLEIKGLDDKKQDGYIGYASVAVLDRDGEIIDPKGWKLDNYRKNPVILTSHDYSKLPIGRALWVQPDETGLKVKFVLANTDTGKEIKQLINEKILNAFSVGFRAEKYVDNPGEKGYDNLKDSGVKRIYTSQELYEISLVGIPSCPDALIQRAMKGEFKSKELTEAILATKKEVKEEIEETVEKEGKILSKKNRTLIADCVSQMMNSISALNELLSATDEAPEETVVEESVSEDNTETKDKTVIETKIEISEDDLKGMFDDIKKNTGLNARELELKKKGRVIL